MRKALVPMATLSSIVQSGVIHTRSSPPTAATVPAVRAPWPTSTLRRQPSLQTSE